MKKLSIFVLAVLLLAPMSVNATESAETEEAVEVLSNDVAGTWTAINNGLTSTHVYVVAIDPSNTSLIYAGTDIGLFKSTDGGEHWSDSRVPISSVNRLVIDPKTPSIIYAGSGGFDGVYKSTDGGEHWNMLLGGSGGIYAYSMAIDPVNPNIVYDGNNFCVAWTVNGGTSWGCTGGPGGAYALAIDPKNTTTIYAGTYGNGVFKNTNWLDAWIVMNNGLTNIYVISLAIDPINTSIVYAGTDGGVFKSTNGGESWSAINNGLTNTKVTTLAIDLTNTNFVYAGTDGGVFESADGGASWNAINSGLTNTHVTSLAIDSSNSNSIYAGTWGGGVFKSSDAEGPPSLHVSKSGTGTGTVTSNPSGIDCGATCKASFTEGTSVTLTADPSSGSVFTGWSGGGCTGTDPCTITLNNNTTIDASFALSGDCAYTISPVNKTFNARGGSVSIKVSATGQTNCPAPLVVEDAEWISVPGTPTWKANKGTVKIAVQKNPGSQSRTEVVSIGGETLTIVEDGAICQLTALKPSSGKYPNTGGSGSFDITVNPQDCGWNVATTFDWIYIDTTTGTGNGTVAFHIDTNGTGKNRTGKIDVSLAQTTAKKKTFTVNESK